MSSGSDANLVEMIPHELLELELGVVGMQSSSTTSVDTDGNVCSSTNATRLLEIARNWRLASRKSRAKFTDSGEIK